LFDHLIFLSSGGAILEPKNFVAQVILARCVHFQPIDSTFRQYRNGTATQATEPIGRRAPSIRRKYR